MQMSLNETVTLYHYTTPAGLLGILQTRQLWATDIRFFNDSTELHYVYEIAERLLDARMEEAEGTILERVRTLADGIRLERSLAGLDGPYVCSFSSNGDQLSQWRGYTGTAGYSLGFRISPPPSTFNPPEVELMRCEYGEQELAEVITELIEQILGDRIDEVFAPWGLDIFLRGVLRKIAPRYKHESFREESEWRVILREPFAGSNLSMSFRKGHSSIIPYYAIPFSHKGHQIFQLEEIVIGPTVDRNLANAAIATLLEQTNQENTVKLRLSDVPFRLL